MVHPDRFSLLNRTWPIRLATTDRTQSRPSGEFQDSTMAWFAKNLFIFIAISFFSDAKHPCNQAVDTLR